LLPRPKEHGKIKGYQKGKGMEKQWYLPPAKKKQKNPPTIDA
jgi:hypothetical protein